VIEEFATLIVPAAMLFVVHGILSRAAHMAWTGQAAALWRAAVLH